MEFRAANARVRVDCLRPNGETWKWHGFAGWQGYNMSSAAAAEPSAHAPSSSLSRSRSLAIPREPPLKAARTKNSRPSWQAVRDKVPDCYRTEHDGAEYFHGQTVVEAMGLTTWVEHLSDKIPIARDEFGWQHGREFIRKSIGRRGQPPYWLSRGAAYQVYQRYA